jgi:hypothetical protein
VATRTGDAGLLVAAYGSYYKFQDVIDHAGLEDGPEWSSVLESAQALQAPLIRVWAGTQGSQDTDEKTRQTIVERTRVIADDAERCGIQIGFEFHRNTLTDTNESARQLLNEVNHANVKSLWQPPNGASYDYCLEGLQLVSPELGNIHCFHWGPDGSSDKRTLSEGADRWRGYLRHIARLTEEDEPRHVLIEFVRDGTDESLVDDAATLRAWIDTVQ